MIKSKQERKRIERDLKQHLQNIHPLVRSLDVCASPDPERYPCERLKIFMRVCADFPADVSDAYPTESQLNHNVEHGNVSIMSWPPKNFSDVDTKLLLAPFVSEIDGLLEQRLQEFGCVLFGNHHPWVSDGEDGVTLLVPFWDEFDYGHYMSDEQARRFEEECGRPPFSDEGWIIDRYTGVGICRSALLEKGA